jgi:hypothetical protein
LNEKNSPKIQVNITVEQQRFYCAQPLVAFKYWYALIPILPTILHLEWVNPIVSDQIAQWVMDARQTLSDVKSTKLPLCEAR